MMDQNIVKWRHIWFHIATWADIWGGRELWQYDTMFEVITCEFPQQFRASTTDFMFGDYDLFFD